MILWIIVISLQIGNTATFPIIRLGADNGLPQSHIYQIYEDQRGFLWLCTGAGIVRYDGSQSKVMHHGTGFPFSHVNKIIEIKKGVFWIADYSNNLWELRDDAVKKVNFGDSGTDVPVLDMDMGPSGECIVSVAGNGGFYIFKDGKVTHWDQDHLPLHPVIHTLTAGPQDRIFLGTPEHGMQVFRNGKIEEEYHKDHLLPNNHVRCIHPFSRDNIWVGTMAGLAIIGHKNTSDRFNEQFHFPTINHVFRENEQSYWISTIEGGGGLIHFDGRNFKPVEGLLEDGTTKRVNCVFLNKNGILFIGTPRGLIIVPNRNFLNYGFKDGLKDTYVKGITQDSTGSIWVGTKQGGVFYLKDGLFLNQPFNKETSLDARINLLHTVNNQVWVGTLNGLIIFEDHKQIHNELTAILKGKSVRYIAAPRDGSTIITSRSHIIQMDPSGIKDITYNITETVSSIWGTDVDPENTLVAVTNGFGLWRLQGENWVPLDMQLNLRPGSMHMIGLQRIADGRFFVSTKDGGFQWDGTNLKQIFNKEIPVWDINEDRKGNQWFATSKGIYKKTQSGMLRYDKGMGLSVSEFNMKSILFDKQDNYWFGGIGGLVRYCEKNPVVEPSGDEVQITRVSSENMNLDFPIDKNSFPNDMNDLTFKYVTPCFTFPGKIVYRHRLEGYDTEFKPSGPGNSVHYTNLPFGNYRFIIQSKLEFGSWSDRSASYEFTILTPWWRTSYAYTAYFLIIVLFYCLLTKWRVRFLNYRNKALQRQIDSKLVDLKKSHSMLEHEIKEKEAAESALKKEKIDLSTILKSIQDSVIKTDLNDIIAFINPEGLALCSATKNEMIGQSFNNLIPFYDPETGARVTCPLTSNTSKQVSLSGQRTQLLLQTRERGRVLVNITCTPITGENGGITGLVYVIRDIDQQQKLQQELFKNQKLKSVGLLAGGIAHDFNNILSGILGNTQLAIMAKDHGNDISRYLQGVETATLSAKNLTKQLLTFSKGGKPVKKLYNLKNELTDTIEFYLSGKKVKAHVNIDPDLGSIYADSGQINQVISNLLINGCQAMPNGGVFDVTAQNIHIEKENQHRVKPGNYIRLSFKDSGCGIPEDIISNIFDPFFSTKQMGSGLGLATSYTIIEKHGGMITVESRENKGTVFHVFLPTAEDVPQEKVVPPARNKSHKAKVLFMDDDLTILEFLGEVCKLKGLDAILTKDGKEAFEAYRKAKESDNPFDLVILDWTIPGGMGGEETIQVLKEYDPSVNALVSSGYSSRDAMAEFSQYGFNGILPKPYQINELMDTIARHIETKTDV